MWRKLAPSQGEASSPKEAASRVDQATSFPLLTWDKASPWDSAVARVGSKQEARRRAVLEHPDAPFFFFCGPASRLDPQEQVHRGLLLNEPGLSASPVCQLCSVVNRAQIKLSTAKA